MREINKTQYIYDENAHTVEEYEQKQKEFWQYLRQRGRFWKLLLKLKKLDKHN